MYELREVSRTFQQGDVVVRAVDDVSLTIDDGEFVVVEGPSGSGKTTMLQLLGGLDRPSEGVALWNGDDLGRMSERQLADRRLHDFGFVFQQFNLIPTLTAAENVEAALAPAGMSGTERAERTSSLLDRVGLADRAGHLPTQLSGGQQQRVAMARALANDPKVILADEPTGNLDSTTSTEIVTMLARLADDGRTVIIITHDRDVAAAAPRVLHIRDGRVHDNGSGSAGSRIDPWPAD